MESIEKTDNLTFPDQAAPQDSLAVCYPADDLSGEVDVAVMQPDSSPVATALGLDAADQGTPPTEGVRDPDQADRAMVTPGPRVLGATVILENPHELGGRDADGEAIRAAAASSPINGGLAVVEKTITSLDAADGSAAPIRSDTGTREGSEPPESDGPGDTAEPAEGSAMQDGPADESEASASSGDHLSPGGPTDGTPPDGPDQGDHADGGEFDPRQALAKALAQPVFKDIMGGAQAAAAARNEEFEDLSAEDSQIVEGAVELMAAEMLRQTGELPELSGVVQGLIGSELVGGMAAERFTGLQERPDKVDPEFLLALRTQLVSTAIQHAGESGVTDIIDLFMSGHTHGILDGAIGIAIEQGRELVEVLNDPNMYQQIFHNAYPAGPSQYVIDMRARADELVNPEAIHQRAIDYFMSLAQGEMGIGIDEDWGRLRAEIANTMPIWDQVDRLLGNGGVVEHQQELMHHTQRSMRAAIVYVVEQAWGSGAQEWLPEDDNAWLRGDDLNEPEDALEELQRMHEEEQAALTEELSGYVNEAGNAMLGTVSDLILTVSSHELQRVTWLAETSTAIAAEVMSAPIEEVEAQIGAMEMIAGQVGTTEMAQLERQLTSPNRAEQMEARITINILTQGLILTSYEAALEEAAEQGRESEALGHLAQQAAETALRIELAARRVAIALPDVFAEARQTGELPEALRQDWPYLSEPYLQLQNMVREGLFRYFEDQRDSQNEE